MKKIILVAAFFIAANPFITKAQELKAVPCATFEYMRYVNEINISSEHTQNLSDGIYVLQLNVDGVMKSEKVLLRK